MLAGTARKRRKFEAKRRIAQGEFTSPEHLNPKGPPHGVSRVGTARRKCVPWVRFSCLPKLSWQFSNWTKSDCNAEGRMNHKNPGRTSSGIFLLCLCVGDGFAATRNTNCRGVAHLGLRPTPPRYNEKSRLFYRRLSRVCRPQASLFSLMVMLLFLLAALFLCSSPLAAA